MACSRDADHVPTDRPLQSGGRSRAFLVAGKAVVLQLFGPPRDEQARTRGLALPCLWWPLFPALCHVMALSNGWPLPCA